MKPQELLNDGCMRVGQVHTILQANAWRIHADEWLDTIKLNYAKNTQAKMSPSECISIACASIKGMINEGKRQTTTAITRYVFDQICTFVDQISEHGR